jgi:hypothetical protein
METQARQLSEIQPVFTREVRGLNLSRRSTQFEGRFGRMFRTLPPAIFDEDMLKKLAAAMTAEFEKPEDQTPEDQDDHEENTGLSALGPQEKFGTLLKLYRSLNWLFCRKCQRLELGATDSTKYLSIFQKSFTADENPIQIMNS